MVPMRLIIVSGMLGVGKTSVILRMVGPIVSSGKKLVIIENDFGAMGVDSEVIENNGLQVRDLRGGCICCTLKANLIDDLRQLQATYSPDYVIVEPTGIADPEFIISSVTDVAGISIESVTVFIVVDAERFMKMRKMFERPLRNQLKVANVVLLNKIDTVGAKELSDIESTIRGFSYVGPIDRVKATTGDGIEAAIKAVLP
jgi:G3E family GTPase